MINVMKKVMAFSGNGDGPYINQDSSGFELNMVDFRRIFRKRAADSCPYPYTPCFIDARADVYIPVAKKELESIHDGNTYKVLDRLALYNQDKLEDLYGSSESFSGYTILFLTVDDVNSGLNELLQEGTWNDKPLSRWLKIVIVGRIEDCPLSPDIISRIKGVPSFDVLALASINDANAEGLTVDIGPEVDEPKAIDSVDQKQWESLPIIASAERLAEMSFLTYRTCLDGALLEDKPVVVTSIEEYLSVREQFPEAKCLRLSEIQVPVRESLRLKDFEKLDLCLFASSLKVEALIHQRCNGDLFSLKDRCLVLPLGVSSELYQYVSKSAGGLWGITINDAWWPVAGIKFIDLKETDCSFYISGPAFPQEITYKNAEAQIFEEFKMLTYQGVSTSTSVANIIYKTIMLLVFSRAAIRLIQGPPSIGKDFLSEQILHVIQQMFPEYIVAHHVTASYESSIIDELIEIRAQHPTKQIVILVSELNLLSHEDIKELLLFAGQDSRIKIIGTQNSDQNCSGRFSTSFLNHYRTRLYLNAKDLQKMLKKYLKTEFPLYARKVSREFIKSTVEMVHELNGIRLLMDSTMNIKQPHLTFRQLKRIIDCLVLSLASPFAKSGDCYNNVVDSLAMYSLGAFAGKIAQNTSDEYHRIQMDKMSLPKQTRNLDSPQELDDLQGQLRPTPGERPPPPLWESRCKKYRNFTLALEYINELSWLETRSGADGTSIITSCSFRAYQRAQPMAIPGAGTPVVYVKRASDANWNKLSGGEFLVSYTEEEDFEMKIHTENPLRLYSETQTEQPLEAVAKHQGPETLTTLSLFQLKVLEQIARLKGISLPHKNVVLTLMGLKEDADQNYIIQSVFTYFNGYIDDDFQQKPYCDLLRDTQYHGARYLVWSFINRAGQCLHQAELIEIFLKACGVPVETVSGDGHRFNIIHLPNGEPVIFDVSYIEFEERQTWKWLQQVHTELSELDVRYQKSPFVIQWNNLYRMGCWVDRDMLRQLPLFGQRFIEGTIILDYFSGIETQSGVYKIGKEERMVLVKLSKLLEKDAVTDPEIMQELMRVIERCREIVDAEQKKMEIQISETNQQVTGDDEPLPPLPPLDLEMDAQPGAAQVPRAEQVYEQLRLAPTRLRRVLDDIEDKQNQDEAQALAAGVSLFLISQFPKTFIRVQHIVPEGQLTARSALRFKGADGKIYNIVRITKPVASNAVSSVTTWRTSDKEALVLTQTGLKRSGAIRPEDRCLELSVKQRQLINKVFAQNGLAQFVDPKERQVSLST